MICERWPGALSLRAHRWWRFPSW